MISVKNINFQVNLSFATFNCCDLGAQFPNRKNRGNKIIVMNQCNILGKTLEYSRYSVIVSFF